MNFEHAFAIVIGHEGGYVNHPNDPGGETKFGISKRAYPDVDIAGLTLAEARAIYRRDYWVACRADDMPEAVRFSLFDTAVNAGVERAIKFLQAAAGVDPDGDIGPVTMAAVNAMDPERLACRFNGHRLDHLNNLSTWPAFGKGWTQRIAENLMEL